MGKFVQVHASRGEGNKGGDVTDPINFCPKYSRSVRFTKTIEPGDKTAVRFTRVFNNDVIN